jgi:signal transduction histidine kinase
MQELELLKSIRAIWIKRAVQAIARGAGVREDVRILLERFYGLLEQAVETGDPAWLDSILTEWSKSLTQSDLEGSKSSLTSLIKELSILTFASVRENLPDQAALDLTGVLLPCFSYAFERAAQFEMEVKVNYLTEKLGEATQALEKLDRSKSDFIAVAAHELRTPLTLIDGYASMLKENLEQTGIPPYQVILVDGIQNGTRRLQSIIDDMIDVSLIDNKLMSLNFQPVWINRLISVLVEEFSNTLKERNQHLEIHSFPGMSEMTFGDPERLLQVFRNILTNAVKYTPDGGQIVVEGRKLPGFLEVTICDNGIGIDAEDTQSIFDKFVRLGNTALHSSSKTKFKGGGPGLGLHIARGILESHGGTIWVESPGYDEAACPGSVFHVLIPLRTYPPDAQMAKLFAPLINNSQKEETKS